jgi:glyoxalase family protein
MPLLNFKDPSGLNIQLVASADDLREPVWTFDDITRAEAIRGMYYALLLVHDAVAVNEFLAAFGYQVKYQDAHMTLLEAGDGGPGNSLIVKADPDAVNGINGLGTVHHVAHRVDSLEDSLRVKACMEDQWGLKVTEVLDRKYFRSIYFRIPGGVLFEVATSGPGFMVDESIEDLGKALKLPDWQEPNRARIEANLLPYKR